MKMQFQKNAIGKISCDCLFKHSLWEVGYYFLLICEIETTKKGSKSRSPQNSHKISIMKCHFYNLEVNIREADVNGLQLCDVSLCAGSEEIPAHRLVLAAASPYFHAMFNGKLSTQPLPFLTSAVNLKGSTSCVPPCHQASAEITEEGKRHPT